MYRIPNKENKLLVQENKNEYSGTIYQSKNIDLDELGLVKLAESTTALLTQDENTDFSRADAMYPCENDLYINSSEVFRGGADISGITSLSTDTGVPTPGVEEDVIFFNDTEVISDNADIYYRSAISTWTKVDTNLTTGSPICMATWEGENNLAVASGNTIKFVNTSWAINATIMKIPNEYMITSVASRGSRLFIATRNIGGGESQVFVASAIATAADASYGAGAVEIYSMKAYKSSVAVITSSATLEYFTGGGFARLAQLPIYSTNQEWSSSLNEYSRVSNRAMFVDNDLILINLSSLVEDGYVEFMPSFPSGIWCYDGELKSLYHKYASSISKALVVRGTQSTTSSVDDNVVLTAGNLDGVQTGCPVVYSSMNNTPIPELKNKRTYYIIKINSTTFKMAETYTDALAGTAIDFTGVGSISQNFLIRRTKDYGWSLMDSRMSVAVLNDKLYDSAYYGRIAMTNVLADADAITTDKTVFCATTPYFYNEGYYVTPKLESQTVEDIFHGVHLKYKELKNEDEIIVKYKVVDTENFPYASFNEGITANRKGVWTDTNTFTTLADLSGVSAGDEVEFIAGVGSGRCSVIESISEASGTYTVNLNETFDFAAANDECYFIVDKWILAKTITASTEDNTGFTYIPIEQKGKFLQLKVILRGVRVAIEELLINNEEITPVV